MISLAHNISYIPPLDEPLSANVVLIEGAEYLWVYDVGSTPDAVSVIKSYGKPVRAILSHFHPDHIANLEKLDCDEVYQCKNTYGYTHRGRIIEKEELIEDGELRLRLFPVSSCHAKGSLSLEVDDTWCFLGDAAYATRKNGSTVYNTGQLLELIRILENTGASYFLMSHHDPFLQKREEVLGWLKEIAAGRHPGEA